MVSPEHQKSPARQLCLPGGGQTNRNKSLVFSFQDLLPVFDDFDRALEASMKTSNIEAIREGLELVQRKYHDLLARENITPVFEVPTEFDPDFHEVLEDQRMTSDEPPIVTEVVRSGYRFGEILLRKALVIIAAGKSHKPSGPVDPDCV